ncbi:MAG: PLP-dependent aminotransferase family protein [Pontibacterium sp.]
MAEKLYEKIALELQERIHKGYYAVGTKLPSIRHLAKEYQVSISTIQQAYLVLEESGFTEVKPKSGHYVKQPSQTPNLPKATKPVQMPLKVRQWEQMCHLISEAEDGQLLNLGWAIPNVSAPSLKPLTKAASEITRSLGEKIFNYDYIRGSKKLREQIARIGIEAGSHVHPEEIIVTSGCQEALVSSLRVVTSPGDIVAIDSPCFFGAIQAIEANGLKALEIPTHPKTGISIDALELALEQWPIKALMITPTCNNPLGYTMPDANKKALLACTENYDLPIIEDDIYGDLSFKYPRPKSLKSFDTQGRVILCSSFSKTVAPGLRIGWVSAGRYAEKVMHMKYVSSLSSGTLQQMALSDFIATGGYERHLRKMRANYKAARDITLDLIQRHFPANTRVSDPDGGFLLWLELDSAIDTTELNLKLREIGITIAPGEMFSASGKYKNQLRLNFSSAPSEVFEWGIKAIGKQCYQMLDFNTH